MALNQEIDFSTSAALNIDVVGINIDEGMFPSGVNDAMRNILKARADAITRHITKTVGTYTAVKTDHNQFWRCTGAVTLNLTAAATLKDGWCLWVRANGGAVTIDPSGAETIDGAATLVLPDGMMALVICTGTTFFSWGSLQNGITTAGNIKPSANGTLNLGVSGTGWLNGFFSTGATIDFGAGDMVITHSSVTLALTGGTTRFGQNTTSSPGAGNNTVGHALQPAAAHFSLTAGPGINVNKTTDSTLMTFCSGGTAQGIISVAGATVTYGAFFGSHWSQLADGSRPDILRGTICESIDELCAWPDEGNEDRLPRFKISDTAGSKSVYGIFAWWDQDHDGDGNPVTSPTNDAFIGSLGAGWIRIAKGVTVQRGDYIESNGDGCGRVQTDDLMRSSTVGKVTSATVVETYPDGSYLVPCTLHCG